MTAVGVVAASLVALAATMAAPAGNNADVGWIAFEERFYYEGGDSWEIFVIRPDGSRRRRVTPTSLPGDKVEAEWSPDGTKIVFRLVMRGLYVIDLDGTGPRRLTGVAGDSGPAWSPDGGRIAFYRRSAIWTMRADGTRPRRLARAGGGPISYDDGGPAWAPDGRRLVFERGLDLWVVNADGSGLARLARGGFRPDWSPRGRRILFENKRADGSAGISVINRDGRGRRQLRAGGHNPTWSPDARRIAFDVSGIYVMSASGRNVHRIMRGPPETGRASWGPA
jgi:Tol biopolymer transport system component